MPLSCHILEPWGDSSSTDARGSCSPGGFLIAFGLFRFSGDVDALPPHRALSPLLASLAPVSQSLYQFSCPIGQVYHFLESWERGGSGDFRDLSPKYEAKVMYRLEKFARF